MSTDSPLRTYHEKRDFSRTPEPRGSVRKSGTRSFIIQLHAARRLHYDLRLELDGVLKSWAVTRGPSLDPAEKRLAVRTEDHPVDYGDFEGVIPSGYGAGTVMLWDRGSWTADGDPRAGLAKGSLKFRLNGKRLKGGFVLVRLKPRPGEKRENWLLIKARDKHADPGLDLGEEWTDSIATGRSLAEIEQAAPSRPAARLTFVRPQLATLRVQPPAGDGWFHELKYDGYRIQVLLGDGSARLLTRNGKDWTRRYPTLASALAQLDADDAIIDGELIAVDEEGRSDFGTLQKAGGGGGEARLLYYAFDLLHLDGRSLVDEPLRERKRLLERLLTAGHGSVRYSDHIEGQGARVIRKACAMHLEGIVSKKADARYRSGRTRSWVKSKCTGNDEFVIAGWRESDKAGRPFSSLLLGEYVEGVLQYRGRVGTGFSGSSMAALARRLQPLERNSSPFEETPPVARSRAHWVTPKLVAQVAYAERTAEGRLRHPAFLGLREDKPAAEVAAPAPVRALGVRLTHPDRVMYPNQGVTKRAIAEYYLRHADRVLPYLANRPLSFVRCPRGRQKDCFFQRHHTGVFPDHIHRIEIREKRGKNASYLYLDSVEGLVAATQLGVLEFHLWGARTDRLERPERLVFDLDPDPELAFERVRDAAREVRAVLQAAGLESFPLLTGGKGIHVVVPLVRRREWPEVKAFARTLARRLADAAPDRYVATASKRKRKQRIFIDWLRNERGATAIAPYSLRARPGAPIATPVGWRELSRITSAAAYTLGNIDRRLARLRADPWPDYAALRQSLPAV
jgi:bifunctional non-homologous end joining protein LigD